ncbi:unnamed protein product [Acanthoscelides obtectus]|uniref:Uncharacterized protein n=1 Tax=Acanthoscelides obtectus TaxID=200917 RepID=A0A9P0NT95_ACAOB|nr:unnamed protein product [Acanthoscelides obtectus]CAK1655013.1 hypothetical protein AOBTE_LOCUS18961 [Acanthoscelides obtectus]
MCKCIILFLLVIGTGNISAGPLYPAMKILKNVSSYTSIPPGASTNLVEGNCTDVQPPDVGYAIDVLENYPYNVSATVIFFKLRPPKIYCVTAYSLDSDPHSIAYIGKGGLNYDHVSVELRATNPHYGFKYNITVYLTDTLANIL